MKFIIAISIFLFAFGCKKSKNAPNWQCYHQSFLIDTSTAQPKNDTIYKYYNKTIPQITAIENDSDYTITFADSITHYAKQFRRQMQCYTF